MVMEKLKVIVPPDLIEYGEDLGKAFAAKLLKILTLPLISKLEFKVQSN
jgi:hypothetical protein